MAVSYDYTKVNPVGKPAHDVIYDTLQIRGWRIEAAGVDLEQGTVGGKLDLLFQEFGTTGALLECDADTIVVIGDSHALSANIIAKRADRVLGGTGALVNYVADGGAAGSGSAVAGTVADPVTTAIVEVGQITTFFGISST